MGYNVVCISTVDGAWLAEDAERVATALGFRLIDEEIVTRAAVEAGVDQQVVADVERRKSALLKLLDGLAPAGMAASGYVLAPPEDTYQQPASSELRGLIQSVIEETATSGNVVIVAHAASLALAERDDVLRVLVTASRQTRQRRVAASRQLDEKEAARAIKRGDAGRADYIKRFYGIGEERPTQYDLVINTDKLSSEDAARLIVSAATGTSEPVAAGSGTTQV